MHEVLVNRLGGLSLPRKSVVRLTDRPDMTLDVYRGRKTTKQQQQQSDTALTDRHPDTTSPAEGSLDAAFLIYWTEEIDYTYICHNMEVELTTS